MNFGVMKDYKLKLRNLHASHALIIMNRFKKRDLLLKKNEPKPQTNYASPL